LCNVAEMSGGIFLPVHYTAQFLLSWATRARASNWYSAARTLEATLLLERFRCPISVSLFDSITKFTVCCLYFSRKPSIAVTQEMPCFPPNDNPNTPIGHLAHPWHLSLSRINLAMHITCSGFEAGNLTRPAPGHGVRLDVHSCPQRLHRADWTRGEVIRRLTAGGCGLPARLQIRPAP